MKLSYMFILPLLLAIGCKEEKKNETPTDEEQTEQSYHLQKVRETDTLFQTPESVIYDEKNQRFFVSNVNKNGWEMDGDGFISTMDAEGKILELKWIEGLSSPKGMGIIEDTLYVANSKEVTKIDIPQRKIIKRYEVSDEDPQLNDIAVHNGSIYVSGSNSHKVYKMEKDSLQVAFEDELARPNGLLFRNDSLFVMNSKSQALKVISPEDEIVQIADSLGAGDGITAFTKDSFIVSDWEGQLFLIDKNWKKTPLLDTRQKKINTADILYLPKEELLLVPTYNANKIVAYQLNKK